MRTVSVLGCGWLGLPLSIFFIENGYSVKGSTTDRNNLKNLTENGIGPYILNLDPELNYNKCKDFFETDTIIINFPPERRDDIVEYHKSQILNLRDAIVKSGIKKALFVSSTSVYPEVNREVTEEDNLKPTKQSGKALTEAESILIESNEFKTTVLRLAGLIGYDRNPRNFLKKRKVISKINSPVNLIHRDDCVRIIFKIVENDIWNETFNACADIHPNRKEFYIKEAGLAGVELGEFDKFVEADYKLVSNKKLKDKLNYSFKYPNPLEIN